MASGHMGSPLVKRQTDTTDNITFPQLLWRVVKSYCTFLKYNLLSFPKALRCKIVRSGLFKDTLHSSFQDKDRQRSSKIKCDIVSCVCLLDAFGKTKITQNINSKSLPFLLKEYPQVSFSNF